MSEPDKPGLPAWHPPHLDQPQALTYSAPRKPLSPHLLVIGGVLLVLGVSVWVSAGSALHSRMFRDGDGIIPMLVCTYFVGPALSVTGTVLLALGRNRRAWIAAVSAAVLLGAASTLVAHHVTKRNVPEECFNGTASSCMEKGEAATTNGDRAEWYARACRLGDVKGCIRWGRAAPDNAGAPQAAYQMFCDGHPNDYRCGHGTEDLGTMCTRAPTRRECQ